MATTSNSRFLAVGSSQPNLNTGWHVRVLDYKDKKSLIAVMAEFQEFSFTQQLNDAGTGSVTLDEDDPWWTSVLANGLSHRAIMDREYVFEAWEANTPRFSWLGQNVANTIVGDDETRAVVISGPGLAQVLKRAQLFRPGWPTKPPVVKTEVATDGHTQIKTYRETSANDSLPAYKWEFPYTWPTMRMWYTTFRATQRRGLLGWVTPMFTATKDSAKQDFLFVKTVAAASKQGFRPDSADMTLFDFLSDCTGQDYSKFFGQRLEWVMHAGFKLDVRRRIGVDRSSTVRFFQGNVLSDERTRDRENIVTRVSVLNNSLNEVIRTDKNGVKAWDIRESWNTAAKEVTDAGIQGQIADRMIAENNDENDQWTIKIPYDDPGRVPYHHFGIGDSVGFNVDYFGSTPTAVVTPSPMRVIAITISMTGDSTVPEVELTLMSIIESQLHKLEREITELKNKAVLRALADLTDVDTSATDGSATSSTLVYNPMTKKWEAVTGGTGSGNHVFFGTVDPSITQTVNVGDFWLMSS